MPFRQAQPLLVRTDFHLDRTTTIIQMPGAERGQIGDTTDQGAVVPAARRRPSQHVHPRPPTKTGWVRCWGDPAGLITILLPHAGGDSAGLGAGAGMREAFGEDMIPAPE